jgi:small subunit ribosomal protein S14
MKNFISRDLKKRNLYSHYVLKRVEYQSLINDISLSKDFRRQIQILLNSLPRNSSRVRIQNRCILTGRGHSVLRFCKLSRIQFRELAVQGLLMGVKKSSW